MTMTEPEVRRDQEREFGWSSRRVCEIAGVTYRQLDYWVRTDLIPVMRHGTAGSGYFRRFSADQVVLVYVIKTLCGTCLTDRIRAAGPQLQQWLLGAGPVPPYLVMTPTSMGVCWSDASLLREVKDGSKLLTVLALDRLVQEARWAMIR